MRAKAHINRQAAGPGDVSGMARDGTPCGSVTEIAEQAGDDPEQVTPGRLALHHSLCFEPSQAVRIDTTDLGLALQPRRVLMAPSTGGSLHRAFHRAESSASSTPALSPAASSVDLAMGRTDTTKSYLDIVLDAPFLTLRGTGPDVEATSLSGHVALFLTESTSIKEITLQFRGKAKIPMPASESYVFCSLPDASNFSQSHEQHDIDHVRGLQSRLVVPRGR